MAQTLTTIRNNSITPIHGRRLGLDIDEAIVGAIGVKTQVEDLNTGTTGTDVLAWGVARVVTSGSSQGPVQHSLGAPIPGVQKVLCLLTTSTGSYQFLSTPNGAAIHSGSDGTTSGVINLRGPGAGIILQGVTTAQWAVVGQGGNSTASLNVSYTTTT